MNRRHIAIAVRAAASVLLIVAAYRLGMSLNSSLEIDEATQASLATISHRFTVDHITAILGITGVGIFWGSFLLGRKRG
jgi:hypothetical protein